MTRDKRVIPYVYFWSTERSNELVDPELGHAPDWDFPLTEGYYFRVLPKSPKECWDFMKRHIFNGKYDAIVVNGYIGLAAQMALVQGLFSQTPIILRGDSVLLYRRSFLVRSLKALLLPLIFRIPVAFMATGTLSRNYFVHYGVRATSVFFFPYAVHNEYFFGRRDALDRKRDELRKVWSIPNDAMVILAVNKLVPREGVYDLLRAFASIASEQPRLWLVICGDGEQMGLIQNYIDSQAVPRVVLAGYQSYTRLVEFYTLADVFVHPGHIESWGVSVNEAMACGLPVILSDRVGSAYDLLREGKNGFIFKAGDIESLRSALLRWLKVESPLKKSMGRASRQIVSEWGYDFTIREFVRALDYVTMNSSSTKMRKWQN